MRFGICLPNFGRHVQAEDIITAARAAEDDGFDSIWTTDHIVVPRKFADLYGDTHESLITLSFLASATEKVTLATSIMILPQRNPILVAKQLATLDRFSKGRVVVAAGAGWLEEEFSALGADFERRGRVFDESIKLLRTLWKQPIASFSGEFFKVEEMVMLPKPLQKTIPILIGGHSSAAIERAATLGDGWHPDSPDTARFGKGARRIKEKNRRAKITMRMTTDLGRKRAPYVDEEGYTKVILSGSAAEIVRQLEEYIELGLAEIALSLQFQKVDWFVRDIRKFSKEIMRSFH